MHHIQYLAYFDIEAYEPEKTFMLAQDARNKRLKSRALKSASGSR